MLGSILPLLLAVCSPRAAEVPDSVTACRRHLGAIFAAIQQYRQIHRCLPGQLTNLVREHLLTSDVLACPAATASSAGSSGSYRYEFELCPLTNALARGLGLTLRNWRQLQMGKLGSDVPLVRCTHHNPMLNLAFGGTIYPSGPDWEERFTNIVDKKELSIETLLAEHLHLEVTSVPERAPGIPPHEIDLTRYYNRSLKGTREWGVEDSPIDLPGDRTTLGGVAFDARGVVQLGSRNFSMLHRPAAVSNIVIGLPCRSLVFLQGAVNKADDDGIVVGRYVIHYDDGTTEPVPIAYGRHVLDWHDNPAKESRLEVAPWRTTAWQVSGATATNWVYTMRWINPYPDLLIDHLDFVSAMTESSPFLAAITVEDVKPTTPSDGNKAATESGQPGIKP